MHLLWSLLVGLVAGWLAGKLTRGSGYGAIGNIILGIMGSFVGVFVFRQIGITAAGTLGSLVIATIGAVMLIYAARLFKKA